MKLLRMPYFTSVATGLDFSIKDTNIPASLLLKKDTNYNVGYTLNRTVVGIKKDRLVFEFKGFSLCRYVSFQIHGQNSTLQVSPNAQQPIQNDEFHTQTSNIQDPCTCQDSIPRRILQG